MQRSSRRTACLLRRGMGRLGEARRTLEMNKRRRKRAVPHEGVYTRLGVSKAHGVGVFAIRGTKKGTKLFGNDDVGLVRVGRAEIKRLPAGVRRLYKDFCIIEDKGETYLCPENFNVMTVSWYLNHSKKPNVRCDENFDFFALRDVKAGEELTVDYDT